MKDSEKRIKLSQKFKNDEFYKIDEIIDFLKEQKENGATDVIFRTFSGASHAESDLFHHIETFKIEA